MKLKAGLPWDLSMVGDDEAFTVTAVGQKVAEPNCFKMQVQSILCSVFSVHLIS